MIGKLTGKITDIEVDNIILDVNGVGYLIEMASDGFLLNSDELVTLYIYTHLREQELRLFGFKTKVELKLFKLLITVSGIGPKTALTILKNISVDELINAVISKDEKILQVPGVGSKTAQRIVLELQGKFEDGEYDQLSSSSVRISTNPEIDEAVAALVSLGYQENEVRKKIVSITEVESMNSSELVKYLLKKLS